MIDFDALVLGPSMAVFGRAIVVRPEQSQYGEPSYAARGVYLETPVEVQTGDGQIVSSAAKTLGVRLSEFAVPPVQGDRVSIEGMGGLFAIEDVDADGQGGAVWTLKQISA